MQSDADSLDVLLTILRPEVVEAAATQLRSGLFDDAIFAAFRRVEHEIQQRTGLTSIGDHLANEAFRTANNRISISGRLRDADRLVEMFGGALGLHKGDRSHKDRPALPCRSRGECIRLLAHASALLDLLDRSIERAPSVVGYQQRDDLLELSVQRVGPAVQVWLDDRLCRVRARTAATLTVDIDGASTGFHDLYLVDGTRQGPAVPIFVSRELGSDNWYRVEEVGIELFRDESGDSHQEIQGVRLQGLENGMRNDRIVATAEQYQVGDYVRWEWGTQNVGQVWGRQPGSPKLLQLFAATTLFNGSIIGPGQPERTVRLSLEPPVVRLRRGEKAPLVALRLVSDGVASWTEPLDSPGVVPDDGDVAHYRGGVIHAKGDGTTALRLHNDGLFCAASLEVSAHPSGSLSEVLTGLPPVTGIACIGDELVISTRRSALYSIKEGKYAPLTSVPLQPPTFAGTDTIAASPNGDLAVRVADRPGVFVLRADHQYRRSSLVELTGPRTVASMTWAGSNLVLGTNTGEVWQINASGDQSQLTDLGGFVAALAADDEALYAVAGPHPRRLLRFPMATPQQIEELVEPGTLGAVTDVLAAEKTLFLTDFQNGLVLALRDSTLREVASGLSTPGSLARATDGTIYVAEFGRGAVARILP